VKTSDRTGQLLKAPFEPLRGTPLECATGKLPTQRSVPGINRSSDISETITSSDGETCQVAFQHIRTFNNRSINHERFQNRRRSRTAGASALDSRTEGRERSTEGRVVVGAACFCLCPTRVEFLPMESSLDRDRIAAPRGRRSKKSL